MSKTVYTSTDLYKAALELRICASSWEPDAQLLGNVRAEDIREMCNDYIRLRLNKGIDDKPIPPRGI